MSYCYEINTLIASESVSFNYSPKRWALACVTWNSDQLRWCRFASWRVRCWTWVYFLVIFRS